MATLNIGGTRVKVDDSFLSLSPEQQNATVEEIARSLPAKGPQVTQSQAGFMAAGQGATLGTSDEMAAAEAASPLSIRDKREALTARASRDVGFSLPTVPSAPDVIMGGLRLAAEKLAPSIFGSKGGEAYDTKLAQERAMLKAGSEQYPLTSIAGNVAGGVALPIGAANTVAGMAKTGAVMGGLYGLGTGEGAADRLAQGATGAVLGGAVGGALGKIMPRGAAPGAPPPSMPVAEAGERLGVAVPRGVASESRAMQAATQKVQAVPVAGTAVREGVERLTEDLGTAAESMAGRLGSGQRFTSGDAAATAIRDWIGPKSRAVISKAYDAVDGAVNPAVKTPLSNTLNIANDISARRASAFSGSSGAVERVRAAIEAGDGLTYQGIKDLRTEIGELLKPGRLPGDIAEMEMKRIYGALSEDLKTAVRNAGGARAETLFNRANSLNNQVAKRREELAKIVGANADQPAETVFDRMFALANDKARGNIDLLSKARKAVGEDDWREFSSGIISRMGRGADGEFSPDLFVRDWGKLAPNAKGVLFDNVTKTGLDDIAAVSQRLRDMRKDFGNPSGTAQNVLPMAILGSVIGSVAGAAKTAGALGGGVVMSKFLASPASVSSAAKWAKAYELAVRKPAAGTVASLNVASRNLAGTVSDKLGVNVTAEQFLRAISGLNPSRADAEQPDQNQRQ